MAIDTILSANNYRLVRILRALANENRFIIFKNLQKGSFYAIELNDALKISRPALGKHVRILINEGLVEQKHIVKGGTVNTIYDLTDFGIKIAEKLNGLTEGIGDLTSHITRERREELTEINTQINSTETVLKGLENRLKNKEISQQDYQGLKSDYEEAIKKLLNRRNELKKRLGVK